MHFNFSIKSSQGTFFCVHFCAFQSYYQQGEECDRAAQCCGFAEFLSFAEMLSKRVYDMSLPFPELIHIEQAR
jgi:hypothetical protein